MMVLKHEWHAKTYILAFSLIALSLDYMTGPFIQFPILFVIPVILSVWYWGLYHGLSVGLLLPAGRFILEWFWLPLTPWGPSENFVNALIQIAVLEVIAFLAATAIKTHMLERKVRLLEGLLPICTYCKKIRDEQGNWHQLEVYITNHSEAKFSHGICEKCYSEVVAPEIEKFKQRRKRA